MLNKYALYKCHQIKSVQGYLKCLRLPVVFTQIQERKPFLCNCVEQMLNSHYPAHSALLDALSLPGNDLLVLRFIFNHCILIVCYLVYLCCSYLIVRTGGIVRVCMCVCVCGCGAENIKSHCRHKHSRTYTPCMWVVGVFCPSCAVQRELGASFDLKSIIVHLNNLACMWTNCVGMIM